MSTILRRVETKTYHSPGASEKCLNRKTTSYSVSTGNSDFCSAFPALRDKNDLEGIEEIIGSEVCWVLGSTGGDSVWEGFKMNLMSLFVLLLLGLEKEDIDIGGDG
jgi:hypothetical protein